MKIKTYLDNVELELEVYKVQVSIFGEPSILIYNEDMSQLYQVYAKEEIRAIRRFIGMNTVKCYVCGNQDPEGRIMMMKVIPKDIAKKYNW